MLDRSASSADAPISLADAHRAVLAAAQPLGTEDVALGDALGRVLACDLHAADDLVPFARSAMDGFAVRASDVVPGTRLPLAAAPVFAERGEAVHQPGTATPIGTGAALPKGADAVVPIERVRVEADAVRVFEPMEPGAHVFPAGEDARRGERILRAGTELRAGSIGLAAAAGFATLPVVRRPRVAVVCTGSELVPVEATPGQGEIRESNGTMLAAALKAAGADVVAVRTVRDDPAAVQQALREACDGADVVITSGGASVGERDYVKAAWRAAGAQFAFTSVAIRPGRPVGFARRGDTLVFVLPGNPAAAFVCFFVLVRPALLRLSGSEQPMLPSVRARLSGRLQGKEQRTFFAFATLRLNPKGLVATVLDNQCSSLTRTASDANALIVIPPGCGERSDGDKIDAIVLDARATFA